MNIPNRVKRFIKHTNSLCVVMEEGEPTYLITSFEWAERMMVPQDMDDMDNLNDDLSVAADEERDTELPVV